MSEPEEVIAEGALIATRLVRELWARRMAGATAGKPELNDLRRRLELFVAAVFPGAPEIGVADPPAPPTLLARLARRQTAHLYSHSAISSTDGERIRLPGALHALPTNAVLARYRLLALQQAARATRGTPLYVPGDDRLHRDLYLLAEAAAVDRLLVRMFPRLQSELTEARLEAKGQRPIVPRPSHPELAVEALVQALLTADPVTPPAPFIITETPRESRRWAGEQYHAMAGLTGTYRGMAPVPLWGTTAGACEPRATAAGDDMAEASPPPGRGRTLPRRPRSREADPDEDDSEPGTWMVRADDLQEKAEDPAGLQRPADRAQEADPGELADALSELPELRLIRSPGRVHEVLAGEDPLPRALEFGRPAGFEGIAYPEWDWRIAAYRPRGAIVRERPAEEGDEAWVDAVLHQHATLIRGIRRDFERLRPRRMAQRRQTDGADLDIDAMVAAFADRRGGGMTDDRFYIDSRPLRRDVAIALLVDASASTDGWVSGNRRIIDVEKEALVIVGEALAALGDPHAILAFSSQGPARIEVQIIKRFDERARQPLVRRRIAGLEPAGFTRAGAAIRHATVGLMGQAARNRLLLLLSDGRPNDVDQYEGRYGVEDTRVAIAEARLQGLTCFCLTVDREAPRYATRIFGRDYAVLSRAERLPVVLTTLLRELMRS